MNPENKEKRPIWQYATLAALLIAIIAIIILIVNLSSKNNALKDLEAEKELQRIDFQTEVDSLMRVHNELKESYGELSLELAEKDSIIQAEAVEIQKLLDSQWDYNRIKKKVSTLQAISQKYVRQMDSLYTVNRELVAENERIREEYQGEVRKNNNLTRQAEELTNKVNMAATMKIYNLSANAIYFKGGTREAETNKANRAERIKINFTLAQNDLVQAGTKVFYVRIADPTKTVICNQGDDYSFESNGETLQYTEKVRVTYDNKDANACAYYIKPSNIQFMAGYYFIDVYEQGGKLIGQTSLELR